MATDEELVRDIRRGEMQAFDELYDRYSRRLCSYIYRYLGDRDQAEDLLQEVFITVLRDRGLKLREGRLRAWLFTVARNACLTHLRDSRRRQDKARAHFDQRGPEADPGASPEDAALRGEQAAAVQDALASLPQHQQDALVLKQVGNLTYGQIARIQGVPEGTVKSRLHNAVKHVQRWIARRDAAGETT